VPRDLFLKELPPLKPLPLWVPDVYALHPRLVDLEGYVRLDGHHCSAPYSLAFLKECVVEGPWTGAPTPTSPTRIWSRSSVRFASTRGLARASRARALVLCYLGVLVQQPEWAQRK
jgi:hypothetical protein